MTSRGFRAKGNGSRLTKIMKLVNSLASNTMCDLRLPLERSSVIEIYLESCPSKLLIAESTIRPSLLIVLVDVTLKCVESITFVCANLINVEARILWVINCMQFADN